MQVKSKICVVVNGENLTNFLSQLEKAQQEADIVELRIDYIKGLEVTMLQLIKEKTYRKAIVCCRSRKDGGNFDGTLEQQQVILETACQLEFDYIDIDLANAGIIQINDSFHSKTKRIISYHNFEMTPNLQEMTEIAAQIKRHRPDVIKLAVYAHNQQDSQKILHFLLNKTFQEELIIVGMGEAGKVTRLMAPLFGGYLTFAANSESQSAPGQLSFREMCNFYHKIDNDFINKFKADIQANRQIQGDTILNSEKLITQGG